MPFYILFSLLYSLDVQLIDSKSERLRLNLLRYKPHQEKCPVFSFTVGLKNTNFKINHDFFLCTTEQRFHCPSITGHNTLLLVLDIPIKCVTLSSE